MNNEEKRAIRAARLITIAQRMLQRAEEMAPETMKKDIAALKASTDVVVEKHAKPLMPKQPGKVLTVPPDIAMKNDR